MAITARQVEVWRVHLDANRFNGIPAAQFRHRQPEGTKTTVPGFPNNIDYATANPRTADNPMDAAVNVQMTWVAFRLKGGADNALGGDSRSGRGYIFRMHGQCPAIDDNWNPIVMNDEDFGIYTDASGNQLRFRIENPSLSPDSSMWVFEIVKVR